MSTKRIEKPFFRWAGGKTWFVKELRNTMPTDYGCYHEPFLGGGSAFLNVCDGNKAYLSDVNEDLMNAYMVIKNEVEGLVLKLRQYNNIAEEYYNTRGKCFDNNMDRAAKFVFLNRTCFNGIYRVNQKGAFNVPYGYKNYKILFDYKKLFWLHERLQNAYLLTCDFENTLDQIKKSDFVFLDPPYTVSHVKNGFIKYNEKLFSWADQLRLANYIEKLESKGVYYILTNAKHDEINKLFGQIREPAIISRASVIGGKNAKRGRVEEYIFTNLTNGR